MPPFLPPRRSPGLPNHPSRQGVNPHSNPPPLDVGQTWRTYFENLSGFQPSAPPASQFSSAPYNPNTYGFMPSAQQSPIHPAFRQPAISGISPDTSTWGVKYNSNYGHGSVQSPKPPQLPVRASRSGNRYKNGCTEQLTLMCLLSRDLIMRLATTQVRVRITYNQSRPIKSYSLIRILRFYSPSRTVRNIRRSPKVNLSFPAKMRQLHIQDPSLRLFRHP